MTIDEAIEILNEIRGLDQQDCDDAIKLGIEALKAWDVQRQDTIYHHIHLLPGETKAKAYCTIASEGQAASSG